MITVLDSINQTTMPYNEFILYRNKHYRNEQQVLILTGSEIAIPESKIPDNLEIHKCGKNPFRIRKVLNKIICKAKNKNQEIVIHLHSIRGAFSTFMAMTGMGLRRSTIYSIHSTFPGFRFHNKVFCILDVLMTNKVTCVSNTSYAKFPALIKKIKGSNMMALQNGVNEERINNIIASVSKPKLENKPVEFIYVARIIPIKFHKFLVDVLADISVNLNVKFVFVGIEDSNKFIRAYANEKRVGDFVEFTGLIPREQVYSRLFQSDVYISSSTLEGLPVSVLEGMYCGLPAILSNIPQHKEIAQNCKCVSLLPFSTEEWVKKIEEFVKMSREQRTQKGNECREYVARYFSLKKMHERYDNIYNQIVLKFN